MRCINRLVVVVVILAVLTGCGLTTNQKVAISKFSTATVVLGDIASSEFAQSRADLIEINKQRVILGADNVKTLDGKLTVNLTNIRIQSTLALKEYGKFLNVLATTDQSEELKKASDSFVASLKNIKGVQLSNEQLGSIGSAIQFAGSLLIEYKRKNALKDVINATSPALNKLVTVIITSFSPDDEAWSLVYDHDLVKLERQIALADKKANSVSDKALIASANNVYNEKRERFNISSSKVIEAAKKVASAESELRDIMANGKLTLDDINAYVSKVEELARIIQIISK